MADRNKSLQAYDAIERLIVFQELAPGSLVSEALLMEKTGLGRTPVREALQRLARERLVEIHPSRGVLVPPASIESQLKLLELRRGLEDIAVRLAASRANKQQRDEMLAVCDDLEQRGDMSLDDFATYLKRMHELIVDAAHNEYLAVAMAPLQGLSRRFWFAHVKDPDAEIATARSMHLRILRAICAGKESEAMTASRKLNDYLVEFAYGTLPVSA
ncbi:GntR family transcriptional regulator [Arthrobacter sp. ISL-28]|uniref:GntR family transcriptional regulator n=1 Tax=Arthrobacter sp. ISL-28 TaxID=2819108 RepID=UPI001BE6D262|nr:GntR family transcriptional regulator [Arthrobacter sp. ISL-28]MBT2523431.1 GntR family transcriptional regulator [Arthrobacter sp. ISL-28]